MVKQLSRVPIKGSVLSAMLLMCMLVSCGYSGTTADSGSQGQQGQASGTPTTNCPAEETVKHAEASSVAYTVSWEAVGADADTNRGVSALHVSALDGTTGKDRWCVGSLQPSQFSLSATRDRVIVEETLQPSPLTLIQNIYGVRKHDGKILWKLPWKSSSPSVQTLTLVTVMENQSFTSLVA